MGEEYENFVLVNDALISDASEEEELSIGEDSPMLNMGPSKLDQPKSNQNT
jgi:hypothetical protein